MGKLVYGLGVNEKEYPTWDVDKPLREYGLWRDMLLRCTEKFWMKKTTYVGATCSENFKQYSFFYQWCNEQVGFKSKNYNGSSWQLDKDLLIKGNKLYSEDTCVFIPQSINLLLCKREVSRGDYPIGVSWVRKDCKFMARCNRGNGTLEYIGSFDDPNDAFKAYKIYKEVLIKSLAEKYKDQLDTRAYQALINYQVEVTD